MERRVPLTMQMAVLLDPGRSTAAQVGAVHVR